MLNGEPKKDKPLVFVVLDTPAEHFVAALDPARKRTSSPSVVKAVLLSLVSHLNTRRSGTEVWPSVARLASLAGQTDRTVRQAVRQLQSIGCIKVRADRGKSSVYTINPEGIRALCDPGRQVRGEGGTPDLRTGVPRTSGPGTPDVRTDVTAKEQQKLNSSVSPVGCSTELKVGDGDQQRKLQLYQVVAGAADGMRSPGQEQPTGKTPDDDRLERATALGTRSPRERPG